MLIEIHAIQNHSPGNLNRDDLGAPKTCYFGGVMRSRISSQCIKRSIRMSEQFGQLLGGVATRRLAQLIAGNGTDSPEFDKAAKVLKLCGIAPKERKGRDPDELAREDKSAGRVYTTRPAIEEMASLLKASHQRSDRDLAREFASIIEKHTAVPDMALCGRMLEPKKPEKARENSSPESSETDDNDGGGKGKDKGIWSGLDLGVEAALQVAHAISTHEARPEVDYFVAADDIPGDDAGAAYVDEAMFASACFYKYFSIHWETLVRNLRGNAQLAAHTVGAFVRGAALTNPTGKQNSFAAHNPPDGIVVEVKREGGAPISYANAFADPVPSKGPRDMVSESIARLSHYIHDLDVGYGKAAGHKRFWFSPNLRYSLTWIEEKAQRECADQNLKALDDLVAAVTKEMGFDWQDVQKITIN
ncbi:MAG: type I-E CRISPR-associated protein Cas7/Cse4/CasC [Phycisphaerae bacterium]